MLSKQTKRSTNAVIAVVLVLAILIFVNILGNLLSFRMDFTKEQVYTLSPESKKIASTLKEPVIVKAYFSETLPPQYANVRRALEDKLSEYKRHFGGNFKFQFITPEDSDALKQEAQSAGIPLVQFESVTDDEYSVKEGFAGVAFYYEDKKEVIPVIANIDTLEYDITSLIYKLARTEEPKVVFMQGEGIAPLGEEMKGVFNEIGKLYTMDVFDYTQGTLPEGTTTLIVNGPKALSETAQWHIDQAIMKGVKVLFLVDSVEVNNQTFQAAPQDSGLTALLAHYGVTVGKEVIADMQNDPIRVQSESNGFVVMRVLNYPALPKVVPGAQALAKGITGVIFPFVSPVTFTEKEGVTFEQLLTTSEKSWLIKDLAGLNPMNTFMMDETTKGPHAIGVLARGSFESFYKGKEIPKKKAEDGKETPLAESIVEKSPETRIVVIGTSRMIDPTFPIRRENIQFFVNTLDWLNLTEGLSSIRTKSIEFYPLKEIGAVERELVKYANMLFMPFLVIVAGIVMVLVRRRRANLLYPM